MLVISSECKFMKESFWAEFIVCVRVRADTRIVEVLVKYAKRMEVETVVYKVKDSELESESFS